jgi:hypothetical protein
VCAQLAAVVKHARLADVARFIATSLAALGSERRRVPLGELAALPDAPPRLGEYEDAFRVVNELVRWLLRSAQLELQWFQLVERLKKDDPAANASEEAGSVPSETAPARPSAESSLCWAHRCSLARRS